VKPRRAVVVGGGPAGLMAAETLAEAGVTVELYDAMRSVGRKLLLAGKGGLNLTHAEDFERFATRYGAARTEVGAWLERFGPQQLRDWATGLGIETFVGSSGRVFPRDMKAAPLLRAWLARLRARGVRLHMRHRWTGWADDGALCFETPDGPHQVRADAVVLALGGGSWSKLGSDGRWLTLLQQRGVALAPLRPSNCGFEVAAGWSAHFVDRHAGQPLKNVGLHWRDAAGTEQRQLGECVVTRYGIEGSGVYAASAPLRDAIDADGQAALRLDLLPARSLQWVEAELAGPRGGRTLATQLKSRLKLHGVKAALLYEVADKPTLADAARLARLIKSLPLSLSAARPLDEAISSAGGVRFEALDPQLMLRALPGVFCVGEMLDWEAPTGGYLLTASMASGRVAGEGVLGWLDAGADPCRVRRQPAP
jgi:uncharacterized flavoprotein (TIGR03862 family)